MSAKREVLVSLFFNGLSKVATYVLLLILANVYTPEQYGASTFALNIRNLIFLVTLFGIPDALVPFIIKKKPLKTILMALFLLNVLLWCVGAIYIARVAPWLWPLLMSAPFVVVGSLATAFWRAEGKYAKATQVGFVSILLTVIGAYFLRGYGLTGILIAYGIGNIITSILLVKPLIIYIATTLREEKKTGKRELLSFFLTGISVASITGFFIVITWITTTVLGWRASASDVASYALASSLAGTVTIIAIVFATFMTTKASQLKEGKIADEVLQRVTRLAIVSTTGVSLGLILILPFILSYFFSTYSTIGPLVMLGLCSSIVSAGYLILYAFIVGKEKPHTLLIPLGIIVTIATIGTTLIVPFTGVWGALSINVVTHLAILGLIAYKTHVRRALWQAIEGAGTVALLFWITSYSLLVGIGTFLLIVIGAFLTRSIQKNDIILLKEAIWKKK